MALDVAEPQAALQIPGSLLTWIVDPTSDDVVVKFTELADRWHEETMVISDTDLITSNANYRRVVDLGEAAIPLILRDLAERGGYWFVALEQITGEQPVSNDDYGFPRRMKDAWIAWGKANGYEV